MKNSEILIPGKYRIKGGSYDNIFKNGDIINVVGMGPCKHKGLMPGVVANCCETCVGSVLITNYKPVSDSATYPNGGECFCTGHPPANKRYLEFVELPQPPKTTRMIRLGG